MRTSTLLVFIAPGCLCNCLLSLSIPTCQIMPVVLSLTTSTRFFTKIGITLQLSPGLNVLLKNGAYRWLIDTEGPLIYSSVSFEFARMKELSIFGFIGFKRMNRTCDFWAAILWMYFKRIQQWGLIMVPQVRILLFFEAWCSRKKCHIAFPSLSI